MTELQRFFVDALGGALDLGLATPDDVLKHVTPDVLAAHLPRPLWAKLIGACLAAPRVDARLVVETIGVAELCANIPGGLLWNVVQDVAMRALGRGLVAAPPPAVVEAKAEKAEKGEKAEKRDEGKAEKAPDKAAAPAEKSEKAADKVADKAPEKAVEKDSGKTEKPAEKFPPVATPSPAVVSKSGPTQPRASTGPVVAAPLKSTGSMPVATPPPASTTTSTPAPGIAAGTPPAGNRAPTVTHTQTAAAPAGAVDIFFEDDDDLEPPPLDAPPVSPHRAQTVVPTGNPVGRPGSNTRPPTGAGASSRRPQARTAPRTTPPSPRRVPNPDFDLDTDVGGEKDVPVDDDQLVDWSASEETVTSGVEVDRKR
jgi:hypothetical protein